MINHTVSVIDNAGNESTYDLTTKIDKTVPAFSVSEDEDGLDEKTT